MKEKFFIPLDNPIKVEIDENKSFLKCPHLDLVCVCGPFKDDHEMHEVMKGMSSHKNFLIFCGEVVSSESLSPPQTKRNFLKKVFSFFA